MRMVSAKLFPRRLTPDQAERRLEVTNNLLWKGDKSYQESAIDETMVRMNQSWKDNQPSGTRQAPRGRRSIE